MQHNNNNKPIEPSSVGVSTGIDATEFDGLLSNQYMLLSLCQCNGKCGRGHEPGECGSNRYRSYRKCNPCQRLLKLRKAKRAREETRQVDNLIESGVVEFQSQIAVQHNNTARPTLQTRELTIKELTLFNRQKGKLRKLHPKP